MPGKYKRTLKSLENKIGQKGLAKTIGVSDKTIRRWKKGKIPPSQLKKIEILKSILKHTKNTKDNKLKDKRVKRLPVIADTAKYELTESLHLEVKVWDEQELVTEANKIKKLKINGKKVERLQFIINGVDGEGNEISTSTFALDPEAPVDYYMTEINDLIERQPSKQLDYIMSYTIVAIYDQ